MLRITAVPEVAQAGYTVLGWRVADIAATIRDLTARGVVFLRYDGMDQDEDGVWTTPGGEKAAWFADPEPRPHVASQAGPVASRQLWSMGDQPRPGLVYGAT
jgi:hypothetical protein